MKPEQIERLEALQERMVEVLLKEADPDTWDGAEKLKTGEALTPQERGNRYWEKKNAAMTLVLAKDLSALATNSRESLGRDPFKDDEMEKRINKAEADAAKLLEKIGSKSRKDKLNGKA